MPSVPIVATHYFEYQWPINFWASFTASNVPDDFAQIRRDGFNTIILLVPLRIFIDHGSNNQQLFNNRFNFLMSETQKAQLKVMLRVGYPHDISPHNADFTPRLSAKWCPTLYADPKAYGLFLAHLKYVAGLIAKFDNVSHVFMAWEDAWCALKLFPDYVLHEREQLSKTIGFDTYLKTSVPQEIRLFFGIRDEAVFPIPKKQEAAFVLYKMFYDQLVYDRFIKPAREIFGDKFAYEQRVDAQVIQNIEGEAKWTFFDSYPNAGIVNFTYWAPFMGQKNQNDEIDAATALAGLERVSTRVTQRGGQKHFIDQFNFVNGTAEFAATSTRIAPDQRIPFVRKALPYIAEETLGYGLWAYRDYRQNYIVNGTFDNGHYHWKIKGKATFSGTVPNYLVAQGPIFLQTNVFYNRSRRTFAAHYGAFTLTFDFDAETSVEGTITVFVSEDIFSFPLSSVAKVQEFTIPIEYTKDIRISDDLKIEIKVSPSASYRVRDFQFYNHVLSNGLYSFRNEENAIVQEIRRFNNTR